MTDSRCALCGQSPLNPGYNRFMQPLCHHEERDCYHRWTVYGERIFYGEKHPAPVGAELYRGKRA